MKLLESRLKYDDQDIRELDDMAKQNIKCHRDKKATQEFVRTSDLHLHELHGKHCFVKNSRGSLLLSDQQHHQITLA